MKKLLMAVLLVALMGTASFAAAPVQQQDSAKKTEQVSHKKHHKTSKKSHMMHKKHSKGAKKKMDSTATSH
jgi:opacity protein-like surface antigen